RGIDRPVALFPPHGQADGNNADCRTRLLIGKRTQRLCANDRSPPRFGSHVLLFGRFQIRTTTRDARCSDLAFGGRTVSGRRAPRARRLLPVLSGPVRMAFRRDRLLPRDYGGNHFAREAAERYARISPGTMARRVARSLGA